MLLRSGAETMQKDNVCSSQSMQHPNNAVHNLLSARLAGVVYLIVRTVVYACKQKSKANVHA